MHARKRRSYNQWSPDARALDVIGGKWTLLIVRDLTSGPKRFVELQKCLPGISTEQLRIRLAEMVGDGLVERQRFREVPPRVEYSLTARGVALNRVLAAVTEWGVRWVWSPPQDEELVNFAALLRTLSTLKRPPGVPAGIVAIEVDEDRLAFEIGDQLRALEKQIPAAPDVTISGSWLSWVQALSPAGTSKGLRISGNRRLAKAFVRLIVASQAGELE
jgi:DNA-binding HxlR family transcriptional regulator